jgi:asparagine N-glycosylation enzyme membrane subunit Stt3
MIFTLLFYLRAIKADRAVDSAAHASIAAAGLIVLALTWRPYALFLSYVFAFHAAYTGRAGFVSTPPCLVEVGVVHVLQAQRLPR